VSKIGVRKAQDLPPGTMEMVKKIIAQEEGKKQSSPSPRNHRILLLKLQRGWRKPAPFLFEIRAAPPQIWDEPYRADKEVP